MRDLLIESVGKKIGHGGSESGVSQRGGSKTIRKGGEVPSSDAEGRSALDEKLSQENGPRQLTKNRLNVPDLLYLANGEKDTRCKYTGGEIPTLDGGRKLGLKAWELHPPKAKKSRREGNGELAEMWRRGLRKNRKSLSPNFYKFVHARLPRTKRGKYTAGSSGRGGDQVELTMQGKGYP